LRLIKNKCMAMRTILWTLFLGILPLSLVAQDVPSNEIWYTSSNHQVVTPKTGAFFSGSVVRTIQSNTYVDGKGVIVLNGDITEIGADAFNGCATLTTVQWGVGVTSLGTAAFAGTALRGMTIPGTVTEVNDSCFYSCTSLAEVTFSGGETIPTFGSNVFASCSALVAINVPGYKLPQYGVTPTEAGDKKVGTYVVYEERDSTSTFQYLLDKGGIVNVQMCRTFYRDGGNNTICLPFSLSKEELAKGPLAGFNRLQVFDHAEVENAGTENETLLMYMEPATSIEAGMPYLIAWPKMDDSLLLSPVFHRVQVTKDSGCYAEVEGEVQFKGVLRPYYVLEEESGVMFFGLGGDLKWPNKGNHIKGFRCYFRAVPASSSSPVRRGMTARLSDGKHTPTSLFATEQEGSGRAMKLLEKGRVVVVCEGVTYDLQGNRVE